MSETELFLLIFSLLWFSESQGPRAQNSFLLAITRVKVDYTESTQKHFYDKYGQCWGVHM